MINFTQFHFVLRSDLKENLRTLAGREGISFRNLMEIIIRTTLPCLEYYQRFLPDENNARELVNADCEFKIPLLKKQRRQILLARASFNIWSMAIIVRRLLTIFLILSAKYGYKETLRILEKNKAKWAHEKKEFSKKNDHMVKFFAPGINFSIDFCENYITRTIYFRE